MVQSSSPNVFSIDNRTQHLNTIVHAATENTEAASAMRLCAFEYAMSSGDGGGPGTAAMLDVLGTLKRSV